MGKFDKWVKQIKKFGNTLIPFNFPQGDPSLEDDLNSLKMRQVSIDGYNLTIYYSIADHNEFYLETVQAYADHHPFLPFSVVVKIARCFLGSENLSLIDFMRMDKKVYCWTKYTNKEGCVIVPPHDKELKHCSYGGFEYTYMKSSHVNFY